VGRLSVRARDFGHAQLEMFVPVLAPVRAGGGVLGLMYFHAPIAASLSQ
jgi:hypothetical protein